MDGPDVVVAVVDSGVDYNHPDLKDAMWINPGMATTAIFALFTSVFSVL